jgi:hypothetical protein
MKDELFGRLESFEIDEPGARYPFSARLARENGWSRAYARRVVAEYKRFVWLSMCAGHPVTPSAEVDEAWHLHMIYTRSYWEDLCGGVLGKPLHHGPTRGGETEVAKFTDWYERTLESYRRHFDEEPPADIWPGIKERFAAPVLRKVDASRHWILPKRWAPYVALGVAIPLTAGCTGFLGSFDVAGGWLCFMVMVGVACLIAISANRRKGPRDEGGGCSGGCGGTSAGCGSSSPGNDGNHGSGCGSSDGGSSSGCGSSGCGSSGCGGGGD